MNSIDLTHFNPGTQKEADFLAGFIARQSTFQYFLGELRNTVADQAARHHLIIAPRGYGKTSLLRRIQIALREEPEFTTRFIALAFREEQHNVISLDVFWRNCIQSLLEAREDEHADRSEVDALDALWHTHAPRGELKREDQDGAPAWTAFDTECRRIGRRPVLLVDNLDSLLAGLEHHQWGLRTALQQPDSPVLIAAASRYPEKLSDKDSAFFDFFRITTLPRLSDQEVMACLRTLADKRGPRGEPVRRLLETDVGRISALNTMAGGNPRTLGVLYTVLEAHMSDDVLAQLSAMLDTFTGWYQARTEELPMQSRAVFDALALHWDPMTASALAAVSGLETTVVSSHLSRLEKSGYVETVALSSTRKSRNGYQVAERFFNIWYLMRNGPRRTRQAIRWLTVFLSSCFSRRELQTMARDKLREGAGRIESTLALAESLPAGRLRTRLLDTAENQLANGQDDSDLQSLVGELKSSKKPATKRAKGTKQTAMDALVEGANAARKLGKHDEAALKLRKAIDLNPKDARPWFCLGILLQDHLERYADAEDAYRRAIELDGKDARLWNNLGTLLQVHLKRYADAEAAYRRAIELDGKDAIPWYNLGTILQYHLRRYADAEAAYRRAIELDVKDAGSWNNLGNLLQGHLERYADAEVAYRRAIELGGDDAGPWHGLGILLEVHLERYADAEAAYRRAIELDGKNSRLWHNLGNLLKNRLERYADAEAAYRRAIEFDGHDAMPWNGLGTLLQDWLGHYEDALAAYQAILKILPDDACGLANCAYLYALHLGSRADAIACAQKAAPGLTVAGRSLLDALLAWTDETPAASVLGWQKFHEAVTSGDNTLWSDFVDDLQRILTHALVRGDGPAVRKWMEEANYPQQFAPLYHAFCAALDDEDHLLSINPEVRGMASKIYRGIARMRELFLRHRQPIATPAGKKPRLSR